MDRLAAGKCVVIQSRCSRVRRVVVCCLQQDVGDDRASMSSDVSFMHMHMHRSALPDPSGN